jgi:hypothetical protein
MVKTPENQSILNGTSWRFSEVEGYVHYAPAGEGKIDFIDADTIVGLWCLSCYGIKYFLYAEKTRMRFAVYEVDGDGGT